MHQLEEREYQLCESLKTLDSINRKIARLTKIKEEMTENIILALGHEHEGQKTYEYDVWKIEVKTPFIYSLNKKLYECGDFDIPPKFNPVKESISYTIDKKLAESALIEAPEEVKDMLVELIDKKPGKPSVTLKARA